MDEQVFILRYAGKITNQRNESLVVTTIGRNSVKERVTSQIPQLPRSQTFFFYSFVYTRVLRNSDQISSLFLSPSYCFSRAKDTQKSRRNNLVIYTVIIYETFHSFSCTHNVRGHARSATPFFLLSFESCFSISWLSRLIQLIEFTIFISIKIIGTKNYIFFVLTKISIISKTLYFEKFIFTEKSWIERKFSINKKNK